MTTQQSHNLTATQSIEILAKKMQALMRRKDIQAFLAEAPQELTKGKDLYQIAMEDIQVAFENIYREREPYQVPLNIYKAILRHTDSAAYAELDAVVENVAQAAPLVDPSIDEDDQNSYNEAGQNRTTKLHAYFQKRCDESAPAEYIFEKEYPRYLHILASKASIDSLETLSRHYVNLLASITDAGVEDSLQNVFSKNTDLQRNVRDLIDDLLDAETDPKDEIELGEDEEFAQIHDDNSADADEDNADSDDSLSSTQLPASVESFLKLYGKELRDEARDKHNARVKYADENDVKYDDIRYTPVDESLLGVATSLMMTPTQSSMIMIAEKGMDTSGIVTRLSEQLFHDSVPALIGGARIIELDLEKMTNYLSKTQSGIQDPEIDEEGVATSALEAKLHVLFTSIDQHNKSGEPPIFLSVKGFEQAVKPKSIMGGMLDEWFTYWLGDDKDLRIIAEMSKDGLESIKKDAPDLYKRLNTHKLKEPTEAQISTRIKDWVTFGRGRPLTEKYTISDSIINECVKLSNKHVGKEDEAQPGLTASILTLAATAAEMRGSKELNHDDVIDAIMTKSGKSRDMIETNSNEKMATLNAAVKANLINQDHAIDQITPKFDLMRMGRKRKNKPIGVFMCTGPTGVGKTEAAKLIAEHLGAGLTTLDMSNYTADNTIAQILGSPAGYVGFGEKTPLESVEDNDINVVLLDEFEKSHPDIFKAFMSAFDEGRIQLRNNKTLNFENTLFLLTSNAGEQHRKDVKPAPGFAATSTESIRDEARQDAIDKRFPPEFKNRIDGILNFNDLNKDSISQIARLKLSKLEKRFAEEKQHGAFEISDAAFEQLTTIGFVDGMGARPLERALENYVDLPLGQWCLENPDKDPMLYKFTLEAISPEVKLDVTELDAPKAETVAKAKPTNDNGKAAKPSQQLG
tara:strand:+ start:197444 stop:200197 length:2754 start_codon:yes stop_codon:yes gene_type:complete